MGNVIQVTNNSASVVQVTQNPVTGVVTLVQPGTHWPSSVTDARDYCTAQFNTGGCNHGGTINNGSNIITIAPGPFTFTPSMVGMNIYASGVGNMVIGSGATVASYISPTQITASVNANSTQTLSTIIVWNAGQDDTAGITATLAASVGTQAKAYFPTRVYVYASEFDVSGLQGMRGDGQNQTFFITKTNSQVGGFLVVNGMPSDFALGAPAGGGFSVVGPLHSVPIHNTALSITNGVMTATVDTSQTATVGSTYKVLLARGTASPYNETYWKITSSNSSQWVGTPYYVDGHAAIGAISNVSLTSNVLTVLENNAFRKVGYVVYFSNVATATWLNGQSATVASIIYSGNNVTGYTYSFTHADYASAADTGSIANRLDTGTVTDNFAAIPVYDGIRLVTNNFPAGSNIMIHSQIGNVSCSNFSGAGFRFITPNFGYAETLTAIGCNEGIVFEGHYPTTNWFSNPSCFELRGSCEVESITLVGYSFRDSGGLTCSMLGGGGCGIGVLNYNGNGVTINGYDLEVQTPWAVDPVLAPGHSFEHRGTNTTFVSPGYLSFNSSANQIGHYIWNASQGVIIQPWKSFLAGGNVAPTNEFYISADSIDCKIIKPNLLNTANWTNLSPTSVYEGELGNYYYGGINSSVFQVQNVTPATNGVAHNSPLLSLLGTYWNGSNSATDTFSFQSQPSSTTNSTTTLNLVHTGSSGGSQLVYQSWSVDGGGNTVQTASTVANSGANVNSPTLKLRSSYWTGSVAATDTWTIQNTLATGANPLSTLVFTHSGSSGGGQITTAIPVLLTGALTVNNPATGLTTFDSSGYTPTSGQPQGIIFQNSNVYSNTVGPYGAGGFIFKNTGVDNNQPKVFIQDNVSSTTLGNTAWVECINVAGDGVSNGNLVTTSAIGGSIEMITPMQAIGALVTVGSISGGSGYANGTYTNVPLTTTTGHGLNALATIVVSGNAVTTVTITGNGTPASSGAGYVVGDTLSAADANLGAGGGSGFSCTVATVQYYNGKAKIGTQSAVTGSSSVNSAGYWYVGSRRSALNATGANTGFENNLRLFQLDAIGQGWIQSDGSGIQVAPIYDLGVASSLSNINSFHSATIVNTAQTVANTSATIDNTSSGASGSSFIRSRTVTGNATVYVEADDSASSAQFVARSNWGGTPGTGFSRVALLTDFSSSDSGWYIDTVGHTAATPNTLNFKTRTAGAQSTVATLSTIGALVLSSTLTATTVTANTGQMTVNGAANTQFTLNNSTNSQAYSFAYNAGSTKCGIFDSTASVWRLQIVDTTGVLTIPTNVASTTSATGAVVVTGGLGVGGNINAGGTVLGSNLSGTNTGDQTITLTGDVTGSGVGSFTATLATVNANTGTFGDATHIPIVTVNGKGLITAMSTETIASVAVSSITGTANQITASASTGAVTLSTPAAFIAPGSVEVTTTLQIDSNTASAFVYSDASKRVVSTAGPTNGQLLIGSTGAVPAVATIAQGATAGVTVTNGAGTITLDTAQDIRTSASPTFVGATFSGAVSGITTLGTTSNITAQTSNVATSGSNKSSPTLVVGGSTWNGASAINDTFTIQSTYAAGANPVATLNITHSGSSGGSQTSLASGNFIIGGNGNFSKVNAITTVGNGATITVASVSGTAQTANVTATNLLASAPLTGMYRINTRISVTTVAGTSSTMPDTRVLYTDGDTSVATTEQVTTSSSANTTTPGTFARSDVIFWAKTGTAIQYDIGQVTPYASNPATTMQFAYHIRLEYLG